MCKLQEVKNQTVKVTDMFCSICIPKISKKGPGKVLKSP